MNVERVADAQRLRIAVLGDFDGVHTRSWLRWFIARGHDIHAISFFTPKQPLDGVTLHVLKPREVTAAAGSTNAAASAVERLPRGLLRLVHGGRYWQGGLRRVLSEIAPDVFHAHFVVEHGFYGTFAGFHPYVVTAWGSDILVEPRRDPISRQIAKYTLARADLITSNNREMASRMLALGARRAKIEVMTLGADAYFGERWDSSANVSTEPAAAPFTVLSTRAHEPLYNIEMIIDAFAMFRQQRPDVRLVVAHSGSLTEKLRERAGTLGDSVRFPGTVPAQRLHELMTEASVFVSIPSSDGTSVALLQAMSAGAFPIVSDLKTVREWVTDGENGLLVRVRAPFALADALTRAASDADLRRAAAVHNRDLIRERGTNETEMARMEKMYLRLAGRG